MAAESAATDRARYEHAVRDWYEHTHDYIVLLPRFVSDIGAISDAVIVRGFVISENEGIVTISTPFAKRQVMHITVATY